MVPTGQDTDLVFLDLIDQSVFLVDSTGPAAGKLMPERLRLAGSFKRGALHLFEQLDNAEGDLTVLLYPPAQVL